MSIPRSLFRMGRLALALGWVVAFLPASARGAAGDAAPADLGEGERARLAAAASEPTLAPWQRDFMLGLARPDGLAREVEASAARPSLPGSASGEGDGAWVAPIVDPRDGHSAVYDAPRDRMIVFGGSPSGGFLNDVWTLSLGDTLAWTKLAPTGTPPSPRWTQSAIYDPLRDRLVVYGGYDGNLTFLSDVWALSLAGTPAWTQLAPTGTPPGERGRHTAIYDPIRDRMVVFGGIYYSGSTLTVMNDVWALSLAGTPAWTQLAPLGVAPPARWSHSAVYDAARDRMLMFGGYDASSAPRNDVWALTLTGATTWAQLAPSGSPPSARYGHSAAYDSLRDRMLIFGGWNGTTRFNDVRALSLAGAPTWAALAPAGPPPSGRCYQSGVYDPLRDRVVVFAGYDGSLLNDVWALSLSETPSWTELIRTCGRTPGKRYAHTAVYDPVRERMLVFGGYDGASSYLGDVWALSLAGTPIWTQLAPAGTPPAARYLHSAIYDPVRDRMLVFGGYSYGSSLDDVWALSLGGTPAWTQLAPTGTPPAARASHSAVYDPAGDRMIVFGGTFADIRLGDVWALSLAGTPAWTQLAPTGTPPAPRASHAAVLDPARDRMIVLGGSSAAGYLDDVWALSLEGPPAWTQLAPAGTEPSARSGHRAIGDPARDRLVVFGGLGSGGYLADAWSLSLGDSPAWTQLAPAGPPPHGRDLHSAIYDPGRDRLLVFAGDYFGAFSDVWTLVWGSPTPAGATCPGDVAWTTGASLPLAYAVTNPYAFPQIADYTLASARAWPGFPITGSVAVEAGGTTPVPLSVAVPDSAANGRNALTFVATLRGIPQSASCAHDVGDATTPVLLSLVSAQADPQRVRLTWQLADAAGLVASVYRRTAGAPWEPVGRISPDASGFIVFEDRRVSPGVGYGYRLGVPGPGGELYAGETWVEVPLAARLALAGLQPNPAGRDLAVAFSLPDASPARLEVFDLAGRRLLAREVGALGGGSHVLRLGEGRALASGVYVLRLSGSGRTRTARAVVVR